MASKTASQARAELYRLIDEVAESHEPVLITGKRNNGILIAEDDWNAVQETLHLTTIPGMRESIKKGLKTPLHKCAKKLPW